MPTQRVHIWIGNVDAKYEEKYFEERPSEDPDTDYPTSRFIADQGQLSADLASLERTHSSTPLPIPELVEGHSWSEHYQDAVIARAQKLHLEEATDFVMLAEDAIYEPQDVRSGQVNLRYLGAFNTE